MQNKIDDIIAFFSGDILTTVFFIWYSMFGTMDFIHPAIKIFLALVVGIVGGAGGLLGKDLYAWLKKKFKLWK